jgi:hypothetical protein
MPEDVDRLTPIDRATCKHVNTLYDPFSLLLTGNREQGTGNREQGTGNGVKKETCRVTNLCLQIFYQIGRRFSKYGFRNLVDSPMIINIEGKTCSPFIQGDRGVRCSGIALNQEFTVSYFGHTRMVGGGCVRGKEKEETYQPRKQKDFPLRSS